jgi:protein TonB
MISKRAATIFTSLLLSIAAGQAVAGERSARLDPKGCEAPEYPARWVTEGEGGTVLVAFLVGTDGKVVDSKIVESSGSTRMDRASARAGARCAFQPGAKDGAAAPSWTKVRFSWVLN